MHCSLRHYQQEGQLALLVQPAPTIPIRTYCGNRLVGSTWLSCQVGRRSARAQGLARGRPRNARSRSDGDVYDPRSMSSNACAVATARRRLFLNSISRSLPRIPSPLLDSRILQRYIRRCFASQAWRHFIARPLLPSQIQGCPISPHNGCYRC